jgi:hypothetical protein
MLIFGILLGNVWYCLLKFGAVLQKFVAMIMKEILTSNKCAKKNENKIKEKYKCFLSIMLVGKEGVCVNIWNSGFFPSSSPLYRKFF